MGEVEALVERLAVEVEGASAGRVVQRALETFGDEVAISFSGAEDVLLIEYAKQTGIQIFSDIGCHKVWQGA